jgi:hypothetical protein
MAVGCWRSHLRMPSFFSCNNRWCSVASPGRLPEHIMNGVLSVASAVQDNNAIHRIA